MLMPRVMPCLLLSGAQLVKTVRFADPAYVGDPVNAIKIYNEKEVDEMIFLDIFATLEGRPPPYAVIGQIASECFMPVCYGGGVRTLEQMGEIFRLGIEKVAVNSAAVETPDLVAEAAARFGSQSVVASIDVRRRWTGRHTVVTRHATRDTGLDPVSHARRMQEMGAGELLLNAVDRDGTMDGYDLDLIRRVAGAVTVPVIALGGAGSAAHLGAAVREGGADAAAAGSLFVYQGKGLGVLINFPTRQELEAVLAPAEGTPR